MQHDGRFQGDMDRNEVEMDLNKFMAMVEEIGSLKDKIRDYNLVRKKYDVYRFTNEEIENNKEDVIKKIQEIIMFENRACNFRLLPERHQLLPTFPDSEK